MDVYLNQASGTSLTFDFIGSLVYEYEVTIPRENQEPKVLTLWQRPVQAFNKSFLKLAKMRHLDFLQTDGVLRLDIKLTISSIKAELFTSLEPKKTPGNKQPILMKSTADEENIKNLINDLENLLKSGMMADVTVNIDKEVFKAHKAILAARSEIFRQSFDVDSTKAESFDIINCSSSTFKHFLNFVYAGEFNSSDADLMELMELAGKFRVKGLGAMCQRLMRKGN